MPPVDRPPLPLRERRVDALRERARLEARGGGERGTASGRAGLQPLQLPREVSAARESEDARATVAEAHAAERRDCAAGGGGVERGGERGGAREQGGGGERGELEASLESLAPRETAEGVALVL